MTYHDDNDEEQPAKDFFWCGSQGQAAALMAIGHPLQEARINPNPQRQGHVQYGFIWSAALGTDASAYFSHGLKVDALTFWDKIYELKNIKRAQQTPI